MLTFPRRFRRRRRLHDPFLLAGRQCLIGDVSKRLFCESSFSPISIYGCSSATSFLDSHACDPHHHCPPCRSSIRGLKKPRARSAQAPGPVQREWCCRRWRQPLSPPGPLRSRPRWGRSGTALRSQPISMCCRCLIYYRVHAGCEIRRRRRASVGRPPTHHLVILALSPPRFRAETRWPRPAV